MSKLTSQAKAETKPDVLLTGSTLQRTCACGNHTVAGGECAECGKKEHSLQRDTAKRKESGINTSFSRTPAMQRKLTIGTSDDPLEKEADHVADRVLSMPVNSAIGSAPPRIQRRTGQVATENHVAPPSVDRVLASSGMPLEPALRQDMEQRFGHDFSRVRVYSDGAAGQSAREVNANAYTVGHKVVFGAGRFAPGTHEGRRLIAHELTHVVQQSSLDSVHADQNNEKRDPSFVTATGHQSNAGQKKVTKPVMTQHTGLNLARDWNPCGPEEDCPAREAGERVRASSASLQVAALDAPEVGEIISRFGIGSSSTGGLSRNPAWASFVALIVSQNSHWEILGFSDCEGGTERNTRLRQQRADAVLRVLPVTARAKIDRAVSAPLGDCVGTNDTEWERSLNRSVVFRRTVTTFDFPEENIKATPPEFVCGPDVTSQVSAAVSGIGSTFAGWSSGQKQEACDALDSLSTGGCAWDIVELHNNAWIYQNYRPGCATQGASPPCGSTAQVGAECYYAGSANYVIFGKMCRLCADYYLSIPWINYGYARFTKSAMRDLIDLYKGSGFSGIATPSGNFRESVLWASAGYDGWPSGGTPPAGDRSNCVPMCPLTYTGPTFRVNWAPHQHTGNCGR